MAITRTLVRWLACALFAGALLVVLGGCTQREESNPFTAPYGDSLTQPFG